MKYLFRRKFGHVTVTTVRFATSTWGITRSRFRHSSNITIHAGRYSVSVVLVSPRR